MFPGKDDHPTYSSRFSHVPDALMIVEAAVGLSKALGPKVRHTKRPCHPTYELICLIETIDPKRPRQCEDMYGGVS